MRPAGSWTPGPKVNGPLTLPTHCRSIWAKLAGMWTQTWLVELISQQSTATETSPSDLGMAQTERVNHISTAELWLENTAFLSLSPNDGRFRCLWGPLWQAPE